MAQGWHISQRERAMNGPARLVICCAIAVFAAKSANAQSTLQPTPPPAVTADAEQWYQSGQPVMFAGNFYYSAGAQIHFNANEMVRTGTYQGVPLYTRTTIEPNSVVFVPLVGGMMQPYERRRDGDLSGTVGSSAPSFPVATSRDQSTSGTAALSTVQAAGPPMGGSPDDIAWRARAEEAARVALEPLAANRSGYATPQVAPATGQSALYPSAPKTRAGGPEQLRGTTGRILPQVTGTSGRIAANAAPRPVIRRAGAANGIFVEFDHARWFSSGPPAPLDATRLTRIGESHGFPVYALRAGDRSTIYMPVSQDMEFVAPYTRRK
jgi:hypothetical protein